MFDSPIKIITYGMRKEIDGQIFRAVQNVGVIVDKEESLKALQYDREQYSKGYADGYKKAVEEFSKSVNEKITEFVLGHQDQLDFVSGVGMGWRFVEEVAEQMKGERE